MEKDELLSLAGAVALLVAGGADASEEKAEELAAPLKEKYPDCEVEVNYGGQPIYYYIISVE